jgi:hypothetical protein
MLSMMLLLVYSICISAIHIYKMNTFIQSHVLPL